MTFHSRNTRFISARRSSDIVTRFRGAGSISGRTGPCLLCSYVFCFSLLDNRRYQRERWCVMRCNERLAVNSAPVPYRGLGIALHFTSKSYKRGADERTQTADLLITSARSIVHWGTLGYGTPLR
jgi:hypothetical protein